MRTPLGTWASFGLEHEPTIGQTPFGMRLREMFFEIRGFKMTTRDGAGLGFGS